jgi:toxin CptA
MLKPPITLSIVPSRQWQLTQCCLFIGIAALSYWVAGKPAVVAMMALGGALGWRAYLRQPKGVLSLTSTASQFHGRWLQPGDQQPAERALTLSEALSEEHQVRCDYLGPWLIGLYVGKQRVWLWPDSAPAESLREVRTLLHPPGR